MENISMFWVYSSITSETENRPVRTHIQTKTFLYGKSLLAARIIWCMFFLVSLGLFIATLPHYVQHLHIICADVACAGGQSMARLTYQLHALGLSLSFFSTYMLTLHLIFILAY